MKPNYWEQAEDENLDEVDPFQLDEDSDFPSSSDEFNSSVENAKEENTAFATAEMSPFLARGEINRNVCYENQDDRRLSAIPEQYGQQEEGPLGESPVLQPNVGSREGMLATMSEPFSLLNADDNILPQLPTHNGRLNSGPLVHIPIGSPTEPSWDEEDTDTNIADAEEYLNEDEEELVPPVRCAFNHALCLNYHGRPWLYSDDDDSEDSTTSDLSDSESRNLPIASSTTVTLNNAGDRHGAFRNCPSSDNKKTVSFESP